MAVTFDNSDARVSSAGYSVSFAYAVSASSNRLLLVGNNCLNQSVTNVTYNGSALTNIQTVNLNKTWKLLAPASGSNTLTASWGTYARVIMVTASFAAVDQTTPIGSLVTASGTTNTPTTDNITCPGNGAIWGWEYGAYTAPGHPPTISGAGNTLAGSVQNAGGGQTMAGGYRSSTGSVAWSLFSGGVFGWDALGVPIYSDIVGFPRYGDMNFMGI